MKNDYEVWKEVKVGLQMGLWLVFTYYSNKSVTYLDRKFKRSRQPQSTAPPPSASQQLLSRKRLRSMPSLVSLEMVMASVELGVP